MPALKVSSKQLKTKAEFVAALNGAAALEHSICCQYLFAAFSIRGANQQPEDDFPALGGAAYTVAEFCREAKQVLLGIAREEMNHLGILCNLLGAIGAEPCFTRPDFPIQHSHDELHVELNLRKFDLEALECFIWLERPLGLLLDAPKPFSKAGDRSIGQLNLSLQKAVSTIQAELVAQHKSLFTGQTEHQVTNSVAFGTPDDVHFDGVELSAIVDLPSAMSAFDEIVQEGEGAINEVDVLTRKSHFNRLRRLKEQWHALEDEAGLKLDLSWNVGPNPNLDPARPAEAVTLIQNPDARRALDLFDLAYDTQLLLLDRLFARWRGTAKSREALISLAFFPLMTMALRPLGELACQRPSGTGDLFAGPRFHITYDPKRAPYGQELWRDVASRLAMMRAGADALSTIDGRYRSLAQTFEHLRAGVARVAEGKELP